jgi:antirestriction protein ArdC
VYSPPVNILKQGIVILKQGIVTSDADSDAAPCGRSTSPSRHLFLLTASRYEHKLSSIWRAAKEVMHLNGAARKGVGEPGVAILSYRRPWTRPWIGGDVENEFKRPFRVALLSSFEH